MTDQMNDWLEALINATQIAIGRVINFVPNLIAALLVLLVGMWIGRWLGAFLQRTLYAAKLDKWFSNLKVDKYLTPFGFKDIPQLLGKLLQFFIFLVALVAAADIAHFPTVTGLLSTVLLYIPRAVIALLILFVGLGAAQLSDGFISGQLASRFPLVKGIVKFLIVTFALLAALDQLGVSPHLVQILFAGIIFAMSLALGLSFGLGGKDAARDVLEKLKKK